MRRLMVGFILLVLTSKVQSQIHLVKSNKNEIRPDFQSNKLYLLMRGTVSKQSFIGKGFNISDTNATHLGIGFFQKNKFVVYDVRPTMARGSKSCLNEQSFEDFIDDSDVYYLKVWQTKISKEELEKAQLYVRSKLDRKIVFDTKFVLNNDDTLYCTEFCVNTLKYINQQRFTFQPTDKPVGQTLVGKVLKRDILTYYPIDFFVASHVFSLQEEFFFKPR